MDDLHQLLTLLAYLQEYRGETVATVAGAMAMAEDELRAAIDRLLLCGTPPYSPGDFIEVTEDHLGRVTVNFARHFARPVGFSLRELLALKLALSEYAGTLAEPAHQAAVDGLLGKLAAVAPPVDARPATAAQETFLVPGPSERARGHARVLAHAARACRAVAVEHFSASRGHRVRRTVEPYGIVHAHDHLYLVARDRETGEQRHFRLDRIRTVVETEDAFEPPDAANLQAALEAPVAPAKQQPDQFVLRLSNSGKRELRDIVPHARITRSRPGFKLTAPLASPHWVLNLALMYPDDVEILEPGWLRARMRVHLADLLARYAADTP